MRKSPAERLLAKITKQDGHWLWNGGVNSNGHGTFWLDDRVQTAQRSSWLLFHGKIENENGVIGTCDLYPKCIAPAHLALAPIGPKIKPLAERFWPFVKVSDPDQCWEWQGTRGRYGYGGIRNADGRMTRAHRIAYELAVGPVPAGLLVRHRCDNPPCCNPAHLVPGTQKQNMQDMRTRKRGNPAKGEKGGNAKLSNSQVTEIRSRHAAGGIKMIQLAREYGVHRTTIERIIHRTARLHG